MSFKTAIISAALSLPAPTYKDTPPETPDQYRERVVVIGESLADETENVRWSWGPRALAVATLVVMYYESRFDVRIHAGLEHPSWKQDEGRARCLGQLHISGLVPKQDWIDLAGVDSEATHRCVRATMRMIAGKQRHCDPDAKVPTPTLMARVFASYGSGDSCTPTKSSLERAGLWARLMVRF